MDKSRHIRTAICERPINGSLGKHTGTRTRGLSMALRFVDSGTPDTGSRAELPAVIKRERAIEDSLQIVVEICAFGLTIEISRNVSAAVAMKA